jgi:hypothetical protein
MCYEKTKAFAIESVLRILGSTFATVLFVPSAVVLVLSAEVATQNVPWILIAFYCLLLVVASGSMLYYLFKDVSTGWAIAQIVLIGLTGAIEWQYVNTIHFQWKGF